MHSTAFKASPGAGGVKRRECDQSCLNNIAKHFCETSEHDAERKTYAVINQPNASSECARNFTPIAAAAKEQKDIYGSEQVPPVEANVDNQNSCCSRPVFAAADGAEKAKACCSKDVVSAPSKAESRNGSCSGGEIAAIGSKDLCGDAEMGESGTSGTLAKAGDCCSCKSMPNTRDNEARTAAHDAGGQSCKESQDRCAAACCTPAENVGHKDACCKSKSNGRTVSTSSCTLGRPIIDETDLCCSSSEDEEKSTQGSGWDDNAGAGSLLCSGKCCGPHHENISSAGSACSDHLQSAFERFESLVRFGQCLCRKMIEEFNFCCCCGQASPGPSHKGCTRAPAKAATKTDSCCKATCCVGEKTAKATESSCEDACCSLRKPVKAAPTSGMYTCYVSEKALQLRESSCEDACCASQQNADNPGRTCEDACCTQEKTRNVFEFAPPSLEISESTEIDIESAAAREHVVLNVSSMTCTGCSRKMLNVLAHIPRISNPTVTFVSGSAAFDFDRSVGDPNDILPLIEKRTGFKLFRIIGEYQELDVLLDAANAQAFEMKGRDGLVSFEKLKAKNRYRMIYDPRVAGARDLLPHGARLPPPAPDAANSEGRKRLISMAWATFVSAIFTIPIVVLSWADNPVPQQTRQIVSFVLATMVQGIAVPEFYIGAIKSLIFSKVIEMDMLVVISITAAYGYSVIAFALAESGIELEQEAFFETSSLLITLVLLGRLIAAIARMRAVAAVSISSLQAEKALLLHPSGETEEIDARLLQIGDTIRVMPHTSIVTDGIVTSGSSAVDESMLTGESDPVKKQKGDAAIAGTIGGTSSLDIHVTRLPNANTISDIRTLVKTALGVKPRVQDLADKVASWFIPIVVAIATVTFAVWVAVAMTVRHESVGDGVGTAITYGIAVLAISCPCALGLAVPMVLVIAGGVAARSGVVIKGVNALERGYKATDVLFDKTGTLTKDDLTVVHEYIASAVNTPRDTALGLAKAMVTGNNHPVSTAIQRHLENQPLPGVELKHVQSVPGSGIQGTLDGRGIKAGNPHWLSVTTEPAIIGILDRGLTAFCVSIDDELLLAYGLRSSIREEAPAVISALQRHNIRCHIVSGDNENAVREVAATVGIDPTDALARCAPVQKKEYVEQLQSTGRVVLFCGDGTNDAIAVAQANVGMQIGNASDVTKGVCDVTLLSGLDGILFFLNVSKRSFRRIVFNFIWSAVYNVFAIMLASGALVKFRIQPAYAGLGEIVSVVPVVLAAMSLIWVERW
ncbi:hypothetical protein LTR37_001376 [Vermiconidia calcicola]|uniref:Uncharacterized protein n=1 Tax=Vermiconidia calcicola TaxID=1690605 RepID=A0ACC3NVX7_9PEZI|nr:hypothetical protein LTR37_001376 [Vermiconidia calcicola]